MWILLIVLLIIIAVLLFMVWKSNRNARILGGSEKRIIFVSTPPGNDISADLRKYAKHVSSTFIDQNKYVLSDGNYNSDKMIKDISKGTKSVIVYGSFLRDDYINIKPHLHIHVCPVEVIDGLQDLIDHKDAILATLKSDIPREKLWHMYWESLCHMDINKFVSSVDQLYGPV